MGNFQLFGFDVVMLLCLDLRCLFKVVFEQHPRHSYVVLDMCSDPCVLVATLFPVHLKELFDVVV